MLYKSKFKSLAAGIMQKVGLWCSSYLTWQAEKASLLFLSSLISALD